MSQVTYPNITKQNLSPFLDLNPKTLEDFRRFCLREWAKLTDEDQMMVKREQDVILKYRKEETAKGPLLLNQLKTGWRYPDQVKKHRDMTDTDISTGAEKFEYETVD